MREIKFRVYDTKGRKMLSFDVLQKFALLGLIFSKLKQYKAMQYTGLKDKKGVEIYEGDLLKVIDDRSLGGVYIGEIEYLNQFSTYGFNMFESKVLSVRDFSKDSIGFNMKMLGNCFTLSEACRFGIESKYKLEVIGNIHENPDLLDTKKSS